MDFNSILFPAPSEDKYNQMEDHKGKLLFIPKYKDDKTLFHIPCMYQKSTAEQKTNKIFIYFHGNAEDIFNATGNVKVIKDELPFNTLCMEYPGYSIYYEQKSADIIESDSLTLYDFLVNECKVNNKDIVVCGRSIGTGPATYIASERKPGALILISPLKSLKDTVKNMIGPMHYLVRDRFNNYERISKVTCPLLIIHGQKDPLIPYQHSIELCERTNGPYELVLPEHMDHNDVNIYEDFLDPIQSFLQRNQILSHKKESINIDKKYFEIPDYLKNKGDLSNNDVISNLVRKLIKI